MSLMCEQHGRWKSAESKRKGDTGGVLGSSGTALGIEAKKENLYNTAPKRARVSGTSFLVSSV
jgi:hypothetical protein